MVDQHIPRLICDPGSENEFAISETWIIDAYEEGDWNGTAGNLVKFYSDTPGSQATIDITAIGDITVSYMDFTDIEVIGGTITADKTCTASNTSGVTVKKLSSSSRLACGVGVGVCF